MANIEARREVYNAVGGDSACDPFFKGKGGQKLGVADKFLINQEVDKYVEEYRSKIGENPHLNHNNDIAFFSPRVEQYGFEVPVADWTMRKNLKIAEGYRRVIKKKREQEKKSYECV